MDEIRITGARTHNLKNISLSIPKNRLTVITGLSGSGKSSLAFDTLFAEGRRRYLEGLSPYARQFLSQAVRAEADAIEGLSPAIAVEQRTRSDSPRSTVGSVTETLDYLRLLYARTGTPVCPEHGIELTATPVAVMADRVLEKWPEGTAVMVLAPVKIPENETAADFFTRMETLGFQRFVTGGTLLTAGDFDPQKISPGIRKIEVAVDRLKLRTGIRERLTDSLETAAGLSGGRTAVQLYPEGERLVFSREFSCPECDWTVPKLEPGMFSANTAKGACPACCGSGKAETFDPEKIADPELTIREGAVPNWGESSSEHFARLSNLADQTGFSVDTPWAKLSEPAKKAVLRGQGDFPGILPMLEHEYSAAGEKSREALSVYRSLCPCPVCQGEKLNLTARHVFLKTNQSRFSLPQLLQMPVTTLTGVLSRLQLSESRRVIAEKLLQDLQERLGFLISVGLGYLHLGRSAASLSGGESQRIHIASEIGSGLSGVLYVLDEPSSGLHPQDTGKLLQALCTLRNKGNTVVTVEHDAQIIRAADFIADMGPGSGEAGGEVTASGTLSEILQNPASLTGKYLSGTLRTFTPHNLRKPGSWITIENASGHNLKNATVKIPAGCLTVFAGVSGSGKSSLIDGTLYPAAAKLLNHAKNAESLPCRRITGLSVFEKTVRLDQEPLARAAHSSPATYLGLFQLIRKIFSETSLARERGYGPNRFSTNVKGGRCEACQGEGVLHESMQFLPDVVTECDVCRGQRFNRETLEVRFQGKNIAEVLELQVSEAMELFRNHPAVIRKLQALSDVGLGYLRLGQSSQTLSGGEAQRVKIAAELAKPSAGKTLYLLDEPTAGLHFQDVAQLLSILQKLCDEGNTVIVIEHNTDVIAAADYVIEMGPGGTEGGCILFSGTPQELAQQKDSPTGPYLKSYFS